MGGGDHHFDTLEQHGKFWHSHLVHGQSSLPKRLINCMQFQKIASPCIIICVTFILPFSQTPQILWFFLCQSFTRPCTRLHSPKLTNQYCNDYYCFNLVKEQKDNIHCPHITHRWITCIVDIDGDVCNLSDTCDFTQMYQYDWFMSIWYCNILQYFLTYILCREMEALPNSVGLNSCMESVRFSVWFNVNHYMELHFFHTGVSADPKGR